MASTEAQRWVRSSHVEFQREDVFAPATGTSTPQRDITTNRGSGLEPAQTTESTVTSLDESLDYVDLYLIHAPFEREQRLAQWRGLVELQR